MYYKKSGETYLSQQAIRASMPNTSLPTFLSKELLNSLGIYEEVRNPPVPSATQKVVEGEMVWVGDEPTIQYTLVDKTAEELQADQAEYMASMVQHFTDVTTAYIEGKVQEYNKANGLAFKDIHSCANYKDSLTYKHAPFCKQAWDWNERVWNAVRDFQDTATSIPTDEEFMLVIESVQF